MKLSTSRRVVAGLAFGLAVGECYGKQAAQRESSESTRTLKYEVVSIHPHAESSDGNTFVKITMTPDGFIAHGVTLKTLMSSAFGLNQGVIKGGPGWVSQDVFDLDAKVALEDIPKLAALKTEERRSMLRAVLQDRFGLVTGTDSKMESVLAIIAPLGERKLKRSKEQATSSHQLPPKGAVRYGAIDDEGQTMSGLAVQLSFPLQQRIVDKTNLLGNYDISLRWTPGQGEASFANVDNVPDTGSSIYTAMWEQLGLKLQKMQVPSPVIVIVSAHRPSQN